MLIDTHAHLYASEFDEDRKEVLENARNKGVEKILLPNIDTHSIDGMMQMEKDFPGLCYPMMGLHPCSVKENYQEELSIMRRWIDKRDFIAIGEIGIDLYWDKTFVEEQKAAFLEQTRWAMEKEWPIVIHSRESIDMILDLLEPLKDPSLRGVFHCFTGTLEQAKRIMDLGFYMGLGGVLTFKNSGLDKVAKDIPMSSLILETDAPYLSPTPFRGKRNESAYVTLVAEKLAEVKEISLEEVKTITTENAKNLFIC